MAKLQKCSTRFLSVRVIRFVGRYSFLLQKPGLDVATLVDTLKQWRRVLGELENRRWTMFKDEFDFGFAIRWCIKD